MGDLCSWLPWFLLTLAVITLCELRRRHRGIPPGPNGLPFLGCFTFTRKNPQATINEWHKRYGDVFSFRTVGGYLIVVINGASTMKEAFIDKADEIFGRSQTLNVLNYIDDGFGIAQSEGADWKEKRRFFVAAAKIFGFGKQEYEEYIHEIIQEMVEDVRKSCGKSFVLFNEIALVTGNIISKIICNKKFEKDDPKASILVENFDRLVADSFSEFFLVGPFLRLFLLFTKEGRERDRLKKTLHSIVNEIVEQHVRTYDPHHQRDFIDAYLNQMKSLEEKGQLANSSFSRAALNAIAFNMLLEGTESTGRTVASLLLGLSQYPEAQRKAQDEIDEVVGRSRLPSWTDRQNTPYLESLILELFRKQSFFGFTTFYSNFEEMYVKGYRIPKRSFITANLWSFNHDPEIFQNPSEFQPERFLGPDGKRIRHESPVSFGLGKRSCVGEALAQMEIYLIISAFLQNFNLYPGADQEQIRAEIRK